MCESKLIADRVVIKRHGEGAKHVKRTSAAPAQSSITTTFEKNNKLDWIGLDDQWRKLPKLKGNFDAAIRPDEFWHKVKQFHEFRLIGKYMLKILALPNANAECERIFSQINDTKTKKRNRLITRTIRGNM
ncbi:unnamed protein product [Parnassius apollo]|uniref:(apollo) hypothetical protein n=1 Tax=Parnassius apollo TaxID=110799 RepID=A0A8S3XKM1_PARAO|nr:unnamed protein product [Parnassius apollo]